MTKRDLSVPTNLLLKGDLNKKQNLEKNFKIF